MARFDFLADVTCPGAELLEAERKGIHAVVFLWVGQERMLALDLFARGDDMSQTGLPVGADPIISGIAITDQRAGEVLSEDGFCHLGGAVSVDVKEGDMVVAPEPHEVSEAIVSPRGLIGVGDPGCPELFAKIGVDLFTHSDCFLIEANQGRWNGG